VKCLRTSSVNFNDVIKEDQVYMPKEVADALRVSPLTVSRAIHEGKLKAIRLRGQWRILGAELIRYLQAETDAALGKPPPRHVPRQSGGATRLRSR
jgi:excisionase family DNA binding protein